MLRDLTRGKGPADGRYLLLNRQLEAPVIVAAGSTAAVHYI